jgi:prefoldin subunit 5
VTEGERLEQALRWLRSHLNRLKLERQSLQTRLSQLSTEIDRVSDEIEIAESRKQREG